MKRVATFTDDKGHVTGIVHGCDEPDQQITVNGRIWRFDFDRMFGPLWLKSDGYSERKCQNPSRRVWDEFDRWFRVWSKANPEHPRARKRKRLNIS